MGLVCRLLFQVLGQAGMDGPLAVCVCLAFGLVLYLAALAAMGICPRRPARQK